MKVGPSRFRDDLTPALNSFREENLPLIEISSLLYRFFFSFSFKGDSWNKKISRGFNRDWLKKRFASIYFKLEKRLLFPIMDRISFRGEGNNERIVATIVFDRRECLGRYKGLFGPFEQSQHME